MECGIESDELSSSHGANSFIHNFKFSVNCRRRIGGVATMNCCWITRWNPHYIYILLAVRFLSFFLWFCPRDGIRFLVFYLFSFNTFFGVYNLTNFHLSSINSVRIFPFNTKFSMNNQTYFMHGFAKVFSFFNLNKNPFSICKIKFCWNLKLKMCRKGFNKIQRILL